MANQLPLDTSGTSPNNKVQDELQTLTKAGGLRSVAPLMGAFFADNTLVVRDAANNQILTLGVDYYPSFMYKLPSGFYEKMIAGILIIKNNNVSNNVVLEYQALGGPYSNQDKFLIDMLATLDDLGHDPKWGAVAKPIVDFPPSQYVNLQDRGVGFEYLRNALGIFAEAKIIGDSHGHEDLLAYEDARRGEIEQQLAGANYLLAQHLADKSNPHQETAHQHGIYTRSEIDTSVNSFVSDMTTRINQVRATLETHIAIAAANPHNTTLAQLGMYSRDQVIARLNQAKASRPPAGVNGYWQYLANTRGSWSHYNETRQAAFYSITVGNGTGRIGNSMYVDGQLISDAGCWHTNWVKRIQTGLLVGSGSTFTAVTTNVGQVGEITGFRFVFI